MNTKKISKFLSFVLRHHPEKFGLTLDVNGWADVDELLEKIYQPDRPSIDRALLEHIVETNDKKRFAFNEDGTKIRASQGHSLKSVDLKLEAQEPPQVLYHGTVHKFMEAIRADGLQKMNRQHVHLSADRKTATNVGSRRGVPVILSIRAMDMHTDGHAFYLSDNGVWLTDSVPQNYIDFKV